MAISALTCRFVLVIRILNMNELGVRDILDLHPSNADRTLPLSTLLPQLLVVHIVLNPSKHLGDPTEMFGLVNAEEQKDFGLLHRQL